MKRILIIGATSAIATEVARCFAKQGSSLHLVGRDKDKLERSTGDLLVRGAAKVSSALFDARTPSAHDEIIDRAISDLGEIDGVLIAHGDLPAQDLCQRSWGKTEEALVINLISPLAFLTPLANYFEKRGAGNITVISSVAGDRGRQSNYIYGTAKAGLSTYLQGLRNRLAHHNVSVTTIKPGFVDTPMTAHLPKSSLFASSEQVGKKIYHAMNRGESVVYVPWFWRLIMAAIIHIPESIFKKLRL